MNYLCPLDSRRLSELTWTKGYSLTYLLHRLLPPAVLIEQVARIKLPASRTTRIFVDVLSRLCDGIAGSCRVIPGERGWRQFCSNVLLLAAGLALFGPTAGCNSSGTEQLALKPLPKGQFIHRHAMVVGANSVALKSWGVHTHENTIDYSLGTLILDNPKCKNVIVIAHCKYSTNHAALPLGFGIDVPFLSSDGAIDRPAADGGGWSTNLLGRRFPEHVRVYAPTRFVNWLDQQPAAVQVRYRGKQSYSLEIDWYQEIGSDRRSSTTRPDV